MDRRDRDFSHTWYSSFDSKAMTITLECALPPDHEFAPAPEDTGSDRLYCGTCGASDAEHDIGSDLVLPAVYIVCPTCDGRGSHVNPAIDAHGLSREDFDDDPDFAESYFRGDYDQPCAECNGLRVVPDVAWDRLKPEDTAICEEWIRSKHDTDHMYDMERKYGA